MKKMTFLFFAIICNISFGQTSKPIHVEYLFINNNTNELSTVNLYFNENQAFSEFININSTKNDNTVKENDTHVEIDLQANDSIGKQYYVTKDSIIFRDYIYSDSKFIPVIVSENTPKYNWKLEDEILQIENLSCNKATLNFRGRSFIAWYTLDIPTPFAPWKFYGLPGLIVRLTTDDNSITFNLTKLNYKTDDNNIIIPSIGEKIKFKDYIKSNENISKEIFNKLESKMPRGTVITTNKVENNGIEKHFD